MSFIPESILTNVQQTELAAWAAEMGAEHKLDLTSDVTHLIVGETQTPKYKYVAREREDVKCLREEWVPAVRKSWMEGADVPLQLLEDQFRLPTFHQLKICITGFEDPDQRKELETLINKHGGEYRGDLRKDCTHLLCFTPAGAKYTSARAWGNICTVSIEWLTMSIERGLILDEQYFDPLLPPEERGKDAWKRIERRSPSLKRARTDDMKMGATRKLRRTASSRFSADSVWQDLIPTVATNSEAGVGAELPSAVQSFAATAAIGDLQSNAPAVALHGIAGRATASVTKPPIRSGLFFGRRFLLHGFDPRRVQLLRQHLESQDAEVESDAMVFSQQSATSDSDKCFTIIPHSSSDEEVNSAPQLTGTQLVTELWIEKCLHSKAYIEPQPLHGPFKHPVPGFDELSISSTGFEGVDLMHVTKVVKLLGAVYSESLTKNTSLVLCNGDSMTRQKFKHAIAWRVPAVKSSWLWECARSGELRAWEGFLEQPNMQTRTLGQKSAPLVQGQPPARLGEKKQLLGRTLPPSNDMSTMSKPLTAKTGPGDQVTQQPTSKKQVIPLPTTRVNAGCQPRVNSANAPLGEVSPNLQPPTIEMADRGDLTIVSSLHSLLAKTRKQSSHTATESCHGKPRKRRILGRARSDLSTRSNVSRADSIDSMNTDGMGTPLEAGFRPSPVKPKAKPAALEDDATLMSAELLLSHDELRDDRNEEENVQVPAMTQIGYDDSEAVIWRAKLAKKMSASKEGIADTTPDDPDSSTRKPVLRDSGGTVSKRTRLNTKR